MILSVLLTCLLIQQVHPYVVSEEYDLEFAALKSSLKRVVQEQVQIIRATLEYEKSLVVTALENLQRDLNQLQQYVNETEARADAINMSIVDCLSKIEDFGKLKNQFKAIEDCQVQPNLQFLQKEVNYFSHVYNNFEQIIVYDCLETESKNMYKTSDIDGKHPCIDDQISQLEVRLALVEQLSEIFIKSSSNACAGCVQYQMSLLDQKLFKLSSAFRNCTDEIIQ
ncbi:unnamed protein product [Phyllotreta striolata]|uniref:Uncharacterized protein n=1 Tax=Phyllotreta striolata TaxID=444603 RepID=A0A9N9TRX2_PHYSR|nr:unnamed protein product [Phyllotreta striolata]